MNKVLLLSFCLGAAATDTSDLPNVSITQSWTQETDYKREVPYKVYGTGGQIVIALHGMAGSGSDWLPVFDNLTATAQPNNGNFVLFIPTGYKPAPKFKACWNVIAEPTQAPDVEFVEAIADQALALTDITDASMEIGIIGNSNGCGLVQRLLIESDKAELKRFVCISTVLATAQYRTEGFYRKRASYNDTTPTMDWFDRETARTPLASGRSLRMVVGTADDKIPLARGTFQFNSALEVSSKDIFKNTVATADGVKPEFLGLNRTGLIWSEHFGCSGDDISVSAADYGPSAIGFQSCPSNPAVAWFRIEGGVHDMIYDNSYGMWKGPHAYLSQMVADFFTTSSTQGSDAATDGASTDATDGASSGDSESSKGVVGVSYSLFYALVLCMVSAGSALRRTSS